MQVCATSGASVFWTLQEPTVERAREMVNRGGLNEADALLASVGKSSEAQLVRACREGREIVRRIRVDYNLSPEDLLKRVQATLPDVTAADIEQWRQAGQVQHRVLDGRLWYWGREPSNLWKLCEEANRRQTVSEGRKPGEPASRPAGEGTLLDHVQRVVNVTRRTGQAEVEPVRHRIRYKLTVAADRPGAKAGSRVRCWLPFPQEYRRQRDVRLIEASPPGCVIAPNAVDARPLGGAPQRTLYFEHVLADPGQPVTFSAVYEYVSFAYCPRLDDGKAQPNSRGDSSLYLQERRPHIVFTPELRSTVEQIVAGETNPLVRARRIFHWFDRNIRYAYEEEYSTIPSLAERTFRLRRGDCGAQGMLFIAMCRLAGVPARWQSGWATFPGKWNMHDWAEIHVEPWGWLPVDVSYGVKRSDDPDVREFYFGHLDAYRLIVNLDYGCELHPPKRDLRSEPVDFQRGEVEIDGRNLYFDEWEYDFGLNIVDRPEKPN